MKKIAFLFLFFLPPLCTHAQTSDWSYNVSASLNSNYIWRGLYVGGLSLQTDASVQYKGLFADMWWNIGTTNWTFQTFFPEVDLTIGYSRWGCTLSYIHMYYFDHYADGKPSAFFDMANHEPGGGGTTGEWRFRYQGPDNVPISLLVCCRTFGRDGYWNEKGELQRSFSSYLQVGYTASLPENWTCQANVGFTPAKSFYTDFKGNFAFCMTDIQLTKSWTMKGYTISAFADLMLNPYQLTADNLVLPIARSSEQKLHWNIGCSIGM